MTTTVLDTALELVTLGYSVLPIRADGSKAAAVTWRPYITTAADETQVRTWFADPTTGLAVVQGAVSGGAELAEIEGRAAHRITELRALAEEFDLVDLWQRLTTGWLEMSPSGGFHFHYRVVGTPVPGNLKLARAADKVVLAETRGEGGYVVAAPSGGTVHPTGRSWTRLAGGPATAPVLDAEERDLFHLLLRTLDEMPAPDPAANVGPVAPHDPRDGLTPGDDYENQTDWSDILTPHDWTLVTTRGRTRYWRRPGKDTGLWSASTGRAQDRDRLFVWSSSTEFEQEVPYTKLGAYALLNHGGDHSAAAKALARDGYGKRATLSATPHGLDGLIAAATITATTTVPQDAETLDGLLMPTVPADGGQNTRTEQTTDTPDTDPTDAPLPPSWQPIDLGPYLDGTWTPAEPTMLVRTDGIALLYPGLVHDFHGESESGKSLVIQAEAAARVQANQTVLYVDFESDAGQVTARMLAFGCTPDELRTHFTYVRPEMSPHAMAELEAWATLLARPFTLAVLDGVTDALGQFGAASKENDDIAAWHRAVPRTLATRTGAAVVLVDHVVKATEGRGRFAIGGQTKMAAIDGASYLVEVEKPLGKGLAGTVVMRIGKDRPGSIRPQCGTWRAGDRTQEAARITIDSTAGNGTILVTVEPPSDRVGDEKGDGPFRPTGLMERISRLLESMREPVSLTKLQGLLRADGTKAKSAMIAEAVNLLVNTEHVTEESGPRNARLLRSSAAYRQRTDPESDAYVAPLDGLIAADPDRSPEEVGTGREQVNPDHFPPLPDPFGNGSSTASHHPAPVGGGEAVESAGHGDRFRKNNFGIKDPTTGLYIDPATGEVIDR
ncbi:bifunctional DNA primase/polymerase [Promicromonospora vindobonensis]|uniref:Bifunctional DNA primase/polymerase n=1 Tax=Promicromonospora vindobonensis TaxID=195748 RepID=A0ABW5VQQ1_9MICO